MRSLSQECDECISQKTEGVSIDKKFIKRKNKRGWGEGGEMTQTLYAHMNKRNKRKDHSSFSVLFCF
jgi:hypothetical protein